MSFYLNDFVESVKTDSSAKLLLLSNLITIFLAVIFAWNLIEVLWIYWFQSITIGLFNFLRILLLDVSQLKPTTSTGVLSGSKAGVLPFMKVFLALFFAVHYGLFHLGYAVFLFVFSVYPGISFTAMAFVFLSAIILFVNHLYSFLSHRKKESFIGISRLMFFPYARIIPMHLTIIFGGIFFFSGYANNFVLVFFLLLKTAADLVMHFNEHNQSFNKI